MSFRKSPHPSSLPGFEPGTFGLEVQRAIHCATGTVGVLSDLNDVHVHLDIEMRQKLSKDNESSPNKNGSGESSATDDNPPVPPKRDYGVDNVETQPPPEYASVKKRKKLISFPPRPEFVYKPENTAASMTCLKNSMIITHLLIWLLGAGITAVGIWLKVDKDFYKIQENLDIKQFDTATTILIIVGVVVMVIGFCGCWGAIASKIWMLVIFSIIMIIIIILEIAVIALVWTSVASQNMQEDIKLKAKDALQHITEDKNKQLFIDLIQSRLACCGVDGPGDYSLDPLHPKPIPGSCTPKGSATPYSKGCYAAVIDFLKGKAALVGGVAVAVLLLQLGVLVFTVCLICSIKNSASNVIF
ncbi:Leukocyte surface antigen CD53 like protein [Argiope bruennichi]|uniref:Leukocyte surface antigen CD53 like protein n=1 Tax=Argiope bruennichi TaxID=94029 RepID=A0A8T0F4R8_ARGBR|nr:Leukocyte surface antigen CD53 like protein [Argiope bruennichi]